MKKLCSLIALLLVLIMAVPTSVLAAEVNATPESLLSVTEVNGVRTAVTFDDTTEYKVVYNQNNNTICFTQRNLLTGHVSSSGDVKIGSFSGSTPYGVDAVTISQDTESGFMYTKWTGSQDEWELQRPKTDGEEGRYYFRIWENSSNEEEAEDFASEVDTLADKEADFANKSSVRDLLTLGAGLLSGYALATGGTLAPAAITAIVHAIGATGDAETAGIAVGTQCNVCMSAIEEVYYATDNMHF